MGSIGAKRHRPPRGSSVAALLCDLIAIPSVNPAFAAGRAEFAGELRIAEFLAATAAAAGLDVEFVKVADDRNNILARLTPSGRVRQRIMLAPHLDTVGGQEFTSKLFQPARKNGRIHGRGACDTKGSVAAMLTALATLACSGSRPASTEIIFAGLVDEENGQAGSRALARSKLKATLAIVGEPTRLEVVTAHKGDLWLELETTGRSAHGSMPHLGVNAVRRMARIVDLLEGEYSQSLRRRSHPLLGSPTINVGTIAGGTQPNVVPSNCRISIDRRTLPGESDSAVRREIAALLRSHDLTARFSNLRTAPCPALETNPSNPLVRGLMRMAAQRAPVGAHYFCDAAVLASAGIPSVVFGPGDIAQAHTEDEWIEMRSLEAATGILTRFLRSLP